MKWSLIIFTFNESGNLPGLLNKCLGFLEEHATQFEVIFVNDGSSDNTESVINKLIENNPVLTAIHHPVNLGIGMALRSGYENAKFEYVCAVPGDGQFDPKELQIVQPFTNTNFYSFFREKTHYSFYRGCLTYLNRLFNRIFLGISLKDVNWVKVYRRDQLDFVDIKLNSSLLESEICAKLIKAGVRPIEIPSVYYVREFGNAKGGSWKTLSKVLKEMWRAFIVINKFTRSIDEISTAKSVVKAPGLMAPVKKNY